MQKVSASLSLLGVMMISDQRLWVTRNFHVVVDAIVLIRASRTFLVEQQQQQQQLQAAYGELPQHNLELGGQSAVRMDVVGLLHRVHVGPTSSWFISPHLEQNRQKR